MPHVGASRVKPHLFLATEVSHKGYGVRCRMKAATSSRQNSVPTIAFIKSSNYLAFFYTPSLNSPRLMLSRNLIRYLPVIKSQNAVREPIAYPYILPPPSSTQISVRLTPSHKFSADRTGASLPHCCPPRR